jgi:hypothetical protein
MQHVYDIENLPPSSGPVTLLVLGADPYLQYTLEHIPLDDRRLMGSFDVQVDSDGHGLLTKWNVIHHYS